MPHVTAADGTRIFYRDFGTGTPVVFSHGWPLTGDDWERQMVFLGHHGYRVIAHDRRGHGKSDASWDGNEMDTYADDLAVLMDTLDLHGAMLVGHSTGGGEVTRYLGRHGSARVARAVLLDAVPPLMVQTPDNPDGIPISVFDGFRAQILADRSQMYLDVPTPFYGDHVTDGLRHSWWLQGMTGNLKAQHDCIKAFSETDFTEDLKRITIPLLIIHGDADQIVPIAISAEKAVKLAPNATLKVYPGGPHGVAATHPDLLNADLLAFLTA